MTPTVALSVNGSLVSEAAGVEFGKSCYKKDAYITLLSLPSPSLVLLLSFIRFFFDEYG